MAVTSDQVRELLDPIEPDYDRVPALGPDALPHLRALVDADDALLAAKAAWAASLLKGDDAAAILERAATRRDPTVRVAAAAALRNLPAKTATPAVRQLLADDDRGVRAKALASISPTVLKQVRPEVERIGETDPDPAVSEIARRVLERPRPRRTRAKTPRTRRPRK
jgi:HEAT repeats